jgi:hypothetical protein
MKNKESNAEVVNKICINKKETAKDLKEKILRILNK